jgi:hypothetical protein
VPNRPGATPLLSEELEHIRGRHGHRDAINDGEEHLQVERHRPHRVRPTPPADELEIAVNKRLTQRVSGLTDGDTDQTRHGNGFIPARSQPRPDRPQMPPRTPGHDALQGARLERYPRRFRKNADRAAAEPRNPVMLPSPPASEMEPGTSSMSLSRAVSVAYRCDPRPADGRARRIDRRQSSVANSCAASRDPLPPLTDAGAADQLDGSIT